MSFYPDLSNQIYDFSNLGKPAIRVTSAGGSTGSSISSSSWSNVAGEFTATPTVGTKNIVVTGLPFTLTDDMVALGAVLKVTSSGNITPILLTNVVVSSGTVTLGDMPSNFVSGETVIMAISGPTKAYDISLDVNKIVVQNPEWAHYVDPEQIVDVTNAAANSYFVAIYPEGYRDLVIQLSATDATGASFVLYATLDSTATVPATGGSPGATWIDITTATFGGAVSGTTINVLAYISARMPERYLLKYVTQNATNTVDVWVRKS